MYMRSAKYDRLLSLLYPAMAAGLAKPFGKRPVVPELRSDEGKMRFLRSHTEQQSRPAGSLSREQVPRDPLRRGAGGDIQDWFFHGAELEAWKRANPGAAADWEAPPKNMGSGKPGRESRDQHRRDHAPDDMVRTAGPSLAVSVREAVLPSVAPSAYRRLDEAAGRFARE